MLLEERSGINLRWWFDLWGHQVGDEGGETGEWRVGSARQRCSGRHHLEVRTGMGNTSTICQSVTLNLLGNELQSFPMQHDNICNANLSKL